jgi:hypothetical protein
VSSAPLGHPCRFGVALPPRHQLAFRQDVAFDRSRDCLVCVLKNMTVRVCASADTVEWARVCTNVHVYAGAYVYSCVLLPLLV